MNAIELLIGDHRRVEKLFKRYEKLGERATATKARLVEEMVTELSVHAGIEETVYYPRVREGVPEIEDEVLESLEEHHLVKTVLAELDRMSPEDERFDAKVKVLTENVRHHVEEEEKEWFPRVRKALSTDELDELGVQLEAARSVVPKRPHPHAPDTPPVSAAVAALAVPLDMAIVGGRRVLDRVRPAVESLLGRR